MAKSVRPFLSRSIPVEKLMPNPLNSVLTRSALMTCPASAEKIFYLMRKVTHFIRYSI